MGASSIVNKHKLLSSTYKGLTSKKARANFKIVKDDETIGLFYLLSIPFFATEQEIRDAIEEKFALLKKLKSICQKDPAKEQNLKLASCSLEFLETKMSLAVYTALNPDLRMKYFNLLKLRSYGHQAVTLSDLETKHNKRIAPWSVFKIFLNKTEICVMEIDILAGCFSIWMKDRKKKLKVPREKFIAFHKGFEDNSYWLAYEGPEVDSGAKETVLNIKCVNALQHELFSQVFQLFTVFEDNFVTPRKISRTGFELDYVNLDEYCGIFPLTDDRIVSKGIYMT